MANAMPVLPYFYGAEPEQFAFYRIPKVFFSPVYAGLSTDAKVLYGLMLDRMQLSARNRWLDEQGRVYIYYKVENIMQDLNCGEKKAIRLLAELDREYGLIERKRQGLGRPTVIYVKNFAAVLPKGKFQTCQNDSSVPVINAVPDLSKTQSNNTEKNKTERNNTELINQSGGAEQDGYDEMSEYEEIQEFFYDALNFQALLIDYPYDREMLQELLDLLVETVCSRRKYIRIGGEEKPAQIVKSRLMKLDSGHIQYVLDCIKKNTTSVRNIRQYMLTTLYNAPGTISSYYTTLVNHDLYGSDEDTG